MANKYDEATVNFEVYLQKTRFLGIASVTLPTLAYLTQTTNGAGIAGNITTPILGQLDNMSMTINFRNFTDECFNLAQPKVHTIELRAAVQVEDVNGGITLQKVKHTMKVIPVSVNAGTLAPASTGDASGEYSVRYWKTTVDGITKMEVDPLNNILKVGSTDYTAALRTALGLT